MIVSSFLSFVEFFSYVFQDYAVRVKGSVDTYIGFVDFMGVLCKGVREVERVLQLFKEFGESVQFIKVLVIIFYLFYLLEKVECTFEQEYLKYQIVYRLLKCVFRGKNGFIFLYMVVDKEIQKVGRYSVGIFFFFQVVKVLFDCGVDSDSRDFDNNISLYIAVQNNCSAIMNVFIEAGVYMDVINVFKKTVYELLDEKLLVKSIIQFFNYVILQCFVVRVLDKNKIFYKGVIFEELEVFIELY